jgi:type IV pilus assembly protein PilX
MRNERGAVLIVALIFLLLITAIAASLMTSGSFQTVMVGNVQQRESIFRAAESAVQQTVDNTAMRKQALNAVEVVQAVPAGQLRALPADADHTYGATIVASSSSRPAVGYSLSGGDGQLGYKTFEIRGTAARNDNRVQTDVVLGALMLVPDLQNGD